MFSRNYKIVAARRFEVSLDKVDTAAGNALVRVDYGAICKADLRYYCGNRDAKTLGLKFPMCLLHEAIGTVIRTAPGAPEKGSKVVLIPNIPSFACLKGECGHQVCRELGDNYCPAAKFCSSNTDGFSQEIVACQPYQLLPLPSMEDEKTAVFCELISIAASLLRRAKGFADKMKAAAVWGDGILGYITSCVLTELYEQPQVVGMNQQKLDMFPSKGSYTVSEASEKIGQFQIGFECVGGRGSETAINQMIDCIQPGGVLVLGGVSEENPAINTRKILEKGLTLLGTTRSSREDFEVAVELLKRPRFYQNIHALVLDTLEINHISDYYHAFDKAMNIRDLGKDVLHFHF